MISQCVATRDNIIGKWVVRQFGVVLVKSGGFFLEDRNVRGAATVLKSRECGRCGDRYLGRRSFLAVP